MKNYIMHILLGIVLALFSLCVSANEATRDEHGLVLLVDYEVPGRPSDSIRVTVENRSSKPMTVVSPPDIVRPFGEQGWWYCGSYQVFLHSADHGRFKYVCGTPMPPAAVPPHIPDLVTLRPGQSIGALVVLPIPVGLDAPKGGAQNEPPEWKGPNWEKVAVAGKRKPPQSGFAVTVEYSPVGYQLGNASTLSDPSPVPELVPPPGQAIESNTLHCGGKNHQPHGK